MDEVVNQETQFPECYFFMYYVTAENARADVRKETLIFYDKLYIRAGSNKTQEIRRPDFMELVYSQPEQSETESEAH
jgi:hypothetical protein